MKLLPGVLGWERVGRSLPGAPVSVQASIGLPRARALSLCKSVPRPANRRLWHRRCLGRSWRSNTPVYRLLGPCLSGCPTRSQRKSSRQQIVLPSCGTLAKQQQESVCGWASTHLHHTDTDTHTHTRRLLSRTEPNARPQPSVQSARFVPCNPDSAHESLPSLIFVESAIARPF